MAKNTVITVASAVAACNAIVDQLDAAAGTLEIQEADNTLAVEFTLANPAFGAAATDGGAPPKAVAAGILGGGLVGSPEAGGPFTADHFVVKNNAGTELWRGTCGTTNADMILDSVVISTGVDVTITAWDFKMPTETTCP